MKIEDLIVTQNGFRNGSQITGMIAFVASGGIFNHASLDKFSSGAGKRLINIARFEDGRCFIHDGHHRVAAIYLGGRGYIDETEYVFKDWKYSDFLEINMVVGWVTPYDPRTHIRLADYKEYKEDVEIMLPNIGEVETVKFIKASRVVGTYLKPRTVLTIQDLLRYI